MFYENILLHFSLNTAINNTKSCLGNYLQILDPPGPMTGLWSFPGSGNTWMRHLIQLSTGYVTGSEYLENSMGGFPGEHITNGSAIVVKSHLLRENANMYDRAILIIRNPLDSFIAESNRMLTGNPSFLSNAPIDKLIEFIDGKQERLFSLWLEFHQNLILDTFFKPIHMIRFEDLISNPIGNLFSAKISGCSLLHLVMFKYGYRFLRE